MHNYRIKYLGHAGFSIETNKELFLIDPWLSPRGAFLSSWFQFPCNHHLLDTVLSIASKKKTSLYITHEHEDHFCSFTLKKLSNYLDKVFIPNYKIPTFKNLFSEIGIKTPEVLDERKWYNINNFKMLVFLDESGINRDSGVLLELPDNKKLLNLNDCKLHDKIKDIKKIYGPIDFFTCQFTGATMHPICYEHKDEEYEKISKKKKFAKFHGVLNSIRELCPKYFIPSAGPACFLDEKLYHLNFEADGVFAKSWEFSEYLKKNEVQTNILNFAPGDEIVCSNQDLKFNYKNKINVNENNLKTYLFNYKKRMKLQKINKKYEIKTTQHDKLKSLLVSNLKKKNNFF